MIVLGTALVYIYLLVTDSDASTSCDGKDIGINSGKIENLDFNCSKNPNNTCCRSLALRLCYIGSWMSSTAYVLTVGKRFLYFFIFLYIMLSM